MGEYSRFDICMGYWMFYARCHRGGLTDRCRAKGRGIAEQLSRMQFSPGMDDSPSSSDNEMAAEIYLGLIEKYHGADCANQELAEIESERAEN